ncbi:uncharacterized protein LOC133861277 isoform X2 [Alnus glutinosa]|uniref:uncharacterized protein LOC133861277 isoform X2 n=1 Tax=Alnus glutinosa TaxID=3517 RepID=UPI002D76F5B7|nr:uncharacterized protein LOC133861277 isoform X2 [Alnus glutinosa]
MNPGRLFCGLRLYLSKCDLNAGGARCEEGKAIFKDWKGSRFCRKPKSFMCQRKFLTVILRKVLRRDKMRTLRKSKRQEDSGGHQ